jgi:hypothetical protein
MHRSRRMSILGITAVVALGFGGAIWAHAATSTPRSAAVDPDNILPINSFSIGTSPKTTFSVPPTGGITVTCTHNVAVTKTAATASSGTAPLLVLPPTFDNGINSTTFAVAKCTDNLGGTESTVCKGAWSATGVDATTGDTEPNTDKIQIHLPIAACVVTTSQGCTITVAPSAAFTITANYADGTGKLTVNIGNLPIKVAGGAACPTAATTSSFLGVYTFNPRLHDN